jgi:hypothetical protein
MVRDAETAAALVDRIRIEETVILRGVSAPVRFVRVARGEPPAASRPA